MPKVLYYYIIATNGSTIDEARVSMKYYSHEYDIALLFFKDYKKEYPNRYPKLIAELLV